MAKQTVNIGSTANDGTGDQLRNAFNKLNQNNDEIYGNNFVTELMLNDDIVGAAELKVTGNGNVGQILKSDGDGTFSWIDNDEGDITGVAAGDGLTGGGTAGEVTLTVVGGTGITSNADDIQVSDNGIGALQLNVTGDGTAGQVLSSDGDGTMTWADAASGGNTASYVTSSAISTWTDKNVYVFTNTSDLTHTLPTTAVGVSFKMSLRGTGTNTLSRNSNLIMGLAENLVLDDLTASFEFFFAGGTQGWVIIGAN